MLEPTAMEEWFEEKAKEMSEIITSFTSRRGTMNDPVERCKDFIRKLGIPILWEHDRFQTLEKGGKLPEKRGLTVDEIISSYPMTIRILLVQLMEQIKREKKEGE